MLPYTTYNIPDNLHQKQADSDQWLWIIVDKSLNEEGKDLLEKIAAAINADFKINVFCLQLEADQTISLAEADIFNADLIISFGVAPSFLGLWIDLNKPGLITMERFTFILTSSLDKLSSSNSAKKELWRCMQVYMETK